MSLADDAVRNAAERVEIAYTHGIGDLDLAIEELREALELPHDYRDTGEVETGYENV